VSIFNVLGMVFNVLVSCIRRSNCDDSVSVTLGACICDLALPAAAAAPVAVLKSKSQTQSSLRAHYSLSVVSLSWSQAVQIPTSSLQRLSDQNIPRKEGHHRAIPHLTCHHRDSSSRLQ
jgi:hypothetical protein